MKVLLIHTYYAERGGEDVVFKTERKLLSSNGFEVETLIFENKTKAHLKFICYPFNINSFFKTKRALNTFSPDVVHLHNWHFGASLSIFIACYLMRVPIVYTLHNYRLICPSATLFNKGSLYLSSLKGNWRQAVKDRVYQKSRFATFWVWLNTYFYFAFGVCNIVSRYFVLTQNAKELYMLTSYRKLKQKFVIKPNFVSDRKYAIKGRQPYFLYVGRLVEDKGVMVAINAFKDLPFQLKIVGNGPLKSEIKEQIARFKNIEYLGQKESAEIGMLMRECMALVFPSVSYEGMPMTILEAFACGCPVIASKFSAMESMIIDGYNGLHFERDNVVDLKATVERYYNFDAFKHDAFCKNARSEFEKKYNTKVTLDILRTTYRQVLQEKADRVGNSARKQLSEPYAT